VYRHDARLPREQVPNEALDQTMLCNSVTALDQGEDRIVAASEVFLELQLNRKVV